MVLGTELELDILSTSCVLFTDREPFVSHPHPIYLSLSSYLHVGAATGDRSQLYRKREGKEHMFGNWAPPAGRFSTL